MFNMRVSVARLIQDAEFRSVNFKWGLACIAALGPQGRSGRLWARTRASSARHVFPALIAWFFGRHGPGYGLRSLASRFVPWPVQRVFLGIIENAAPQGQSSAQPASKPVTIRSSGSRHPSFTRSTGSRWLSMYAARRSV